MTKKEIEKYTEKVLSRISFDQLHTLIQKHPLCISILKDKDGKLRWKITNMGKFPELKEMYNSCDKHNFKDLKGLLINRDPTSVYITLPDSIEYVYVEGEIKV